MIRTSFAAGLAASLAMIVAGTEARSAPAPGTASRAPELWTVIVAIESYDDAEIPRCPGAIRDATALARWFTATAQWGSSHILLMNENGERKHGRPEDPLRALRPTRENLDWALKQWMGSRLKPGDIGLVYFAGQSAVVDDQERLLPIDASTEDLGHTGWSPEEAIDELAPRKQASLVVWIDAASPLREVADERPSTDHAPAVNLLHQLTRWPGVTAWLGHSRPAIDGPELGPFLAALARGLGSQPNNLVACLNQMQQDPVLKAGGFRVRGGVSPLLALWPDELLPEHKFKPGLVLQQGHADGVTAVVGSADGELLITASLDSTIRIWKAREGARELLRLLAYHTNGVTAMALSPNGRWLASGDGMGQVRVWDLAEQRERPDEGASPHRQRITGLAFLPQKDKGRFVTLDQDGQSTIWDASGPVLKKEPFLSIELVRMAVAAGEGPVAVALADPSGKLILIGGDGKPRRAIGGSGGRPTAVHLAPDGRWLAAGDEDGRVRVWNAETGSLLYQYDYAERIGALRFGPAGGLAVAAGDRMFLAALNAKGPGISLEGVADDVESVLFSGDAQYLAALTTNGNRHLWSVRDLAKPQARSLPTDRRSPGGTCMAFDRDLQKLIIGEGDGGIRSWDLGTRRERPRIAPHRAKVESLSVSVDARFLLQITQDGVALVWDMKEGRGARIVPGRWSAGVFLPGSSQLVMARHPNEGGEVVLLDRESGRVRKRFERPKVAGGTGVSQAAFGRLAVAADGTKVAAATAAGQVEMACVWDVDGGAPRVYRGHTRTITAIGFSGDAKLFMTASEDGTVKLWDLAAAAAAPAPDAPPPAPLMSVSATPPRPITAAAINPANPRSIVAAYWAPGQFGQVLLWEAPPGQPPRARPLGEMIGRPHNVIFSPDGHYAGAAGQDKAVHLWALEDGRPPARVIFDLEHQHTEQVKALAAWPSSEMVVGGAMVVSGSDDSMVKIWKLDAKNRRGTLLGTLVAIPTEVEEKPGSGRFVDSSRRADWLAFTPDGIYDSSLEGDRLVSFVLEQQVRPLEQYAEQFHKFQLTDDFRLGARPQPPSYSPPPALVIDPPPAPAVAGRDAELKLSVADPAIDLNALRLYQNGVPVQTGADLKPLDQRGHYAAQVRLRKGVNRFYAMASRPDDIDARSEDVELRYEGEDPPGRLHVLSLGVKDYARNALRFASLDAQQMANQLHQNGIEGINQQGQKIVLTDGDVSERSVQDAFTTLRREVKGRPEDVVVVFLAGHTDVLKDDTGRERFSLLLSPFPFPASAPLVAMNRGVGVSGVTGSALPPGVDLPFYVIYRNMSRLDALQRLVIIDACQAEAIFNDPAVKRIEQALERDTHRSRTSYLLAARRGEAANESSLLEHGLLTYVLLKGMQAPGLRPLPVSLPAFEENPTADADGDGFVTSLELREYADKTLPVLASRLPDLMQRSGPASTSPAPTQSAAAEPLRIQAAEGGGFRLISLRSLGKP